MYTIKGFVVFCSTTNIYFYSFIITIIKAFTIKLNYLKLKLASNCCFIKHKCMSYKFTNMTICTRRELP